MILHLLNALHRVEIIIFIFFRKKIFGAKHYFPDKFDIKNLVILRVGGELLKQPDFAYLSK